MVIETDLCDYSSYRSPCNVDGRPAFSEAKSDACENKMSLKDHTSKLKMLILPEYLRTFTDSTRSSSYQCNATIKLSGVRSSCTAANK
jgi:hypothetical protein